MDKYKIIKAINRHRKLAKIFLAMYMHLPLNNKLGGNISHGLSFIKGCKILCRGKNNKIVIGDFTRLIGCTIRIQGNNNTVIIGDACSCNHADIWMEDDNNTLQIGDKTALCGSIQLAVIEGTQLIIGKDCLFSSKIDIRTGDSHSLIQQDTGKRINYSRSITIEDHVWVGTGVTILKGTHIANHCMVGAGSLLCKKYDDSNCVIAGNPAKEVKSNVDWLPQRI